MAGLAPAYIEVSTVKIPGTNTVIGYLKQLVVNNIRLPWPEGEAGQDELELRVHSAGVSGGYPQGSCVLTFTGELVENEWWDEQDDQSPQYVVPEQYNDFAGRPILNVKVLGVGSLSMLTTPMLAVADSGLRFAFSREDWTAPLVLAE